MKSSSRSSIWAPRSLMCRPGALRLPERMQQGRNERAFIGSSKSSIWVPGSLVYGPGTHKPYMNIDRKRHQGRSELVSKPNIVPSLLICGPGAYKLYLSKCSKTNHRRTELALNGSSKSGAWVLGMELSDLLKQTQQEKPFQKWTSYEGLIQIRYLLIQVIHRWTWKSQALYLRTGAHYLSSSIRRQQWRNEQIPKGTLNEVFEYLDC